MAILKSEIKNRYSQIPNSVIHDKDLSDGDYRLLILLYSFPNNWKINQEYLAQKVKCNKRNVNSKLKRIKEAGYLEIQKNIDKKKKEVDFIYVLKEKNVMSVGDYMSVGDTSVGDYMSVGDTSVGDVHNNTNINNTNNNENINNNIQEKFFESEILNETINDWIKYKKEKRDSYKEQGLKSLITQIKNNIKKYGEEKVINIIVESMANNYQGIVWNRLEKIPKEKPKEEEIYFN